MKPVVTLGAVSPAKILAAGLALCIFIFGIVACGGGGGGGSTATAPGGGGGSGGGTPTLFMYAFLPGSTTYSVSGFSVDTTTGALSAVPAASLTTTNVPVGTCGTNNCQTSGSTYYPDSILYLSSDADNTIRPFTLNLSTGALTEQTSATASYTGVLNTANSNGRAVQSHVPNVLYFSPSTATSGGTMTVDAFSVNSSTGGLGALAGTVLSSGNFAGVLTTPTFSLAISCGTNCSPITTYAINTNGSIGATNGSPTITGTPIGLVSQGNILLSTDGTKIYAYPISGSGIGALLGTTTSIGNLGSAGTTPNCQSGRTSQSNVVVVNCSASGSTTVYVQGFSINTSGVMTPGAGAFNYVSTNGNGLKFDNSGKYFFTQSGGSTNTNTEYSVDASGSITPLNTTPLAGWITMPPVGEFLYLQDNTTGNLTPYQINSSNGSLTMGTATTLTSSPGNRYYLFGGSSVQSYIPINN